MAQSPEEMAQSMIANMKEKTGKSLDQWLKMVGTAKLEKHGQIVKYLKSELGVTHGYANLIAHSYLDKTRGASGATADLVTAQYSGSKIGLRPIYDTLVKAVEEFGKDLEIAPKKSYVSLRRSKQFAIVQPSTKTRVDVGINLQGVAPSGRLEASGSFNAMVSHRVRLNDVKEVDKELVGWLKKAYQAS